MSLSFTPVATLARHALYSRTASRAANGLTNSLATHYRHINRPAFGGTAYNSTFSRHFHSTHPTMSDPSKSKSESEWRAILNPEQVREPDTDAPVSIIKSL